MNLHRMSAAVLLTTSLTACGEVTEGNSTASSTGVATSTTDPAQTTDGETQSTGDPTDTGGSETQTPSTTEDPTTEDPTTEDPTTEDPTTEDPTDPTTEDPTDPTTEDPTDPTTEDPTTEDPTSDSDTGNAMCGNGEVEDGEQCDDGNDDDTDACTSLCSPPSCSDGIQSGNETDVDCGGPDCDSCDNLACDQPDECPGLICLDNLCAVPEDCDDLLFKNPQLQDQNGTYLIDPDGQNGEDPFEVFCDMTFDSGGWTRVLDDDFEDGGDGWSKTQTTTCGNVGKILGGYGQFSNEVVSKSVNALGVQHDLVLLRGTYYAIDSWDGEQAFARIEAFDVWSTACDHDNNSCNHEQNGNICGGNYPDGSVLVEEVAGESSNEFLIGFGSTLNQSATDESWGVDDVEVFVR